ncbi:MFS transporter [Sphingomonas hengshuiensis]|uniref:MFS transporter n=1 Tax=Sphingomonas hengshuiensis TaxID=1609977 RepID=A0A7U5BF03_9SPHN|nr:MFS transporter [Sphingomonas hengshuiensis]AJP74063.1 MFS transporter [Sphingomonas hengshuiensis]
MTALTPIPSQDSPRGWIVVFAAMIGVAVGLGPIPFYTIGMFAPELSKAFGWSFASLMGSLAVQSAVVMVMSPLAGWTVDRFGARRVAMISLTLFGLAFMSLALSTGSLWLYYGQWVLIAIVGAGTLSATWTRVVNGWFDRNLGIALGVASTGTGITGFLIKPFSAWLILEFGWRIALGVIGLIPIVIGLPVIALLFRERTGDNSAKGSVAEQREIDGRTEFGLTLVEALRSPRFWVMGVAFLFVAFALTAPTPNLENILRTFHFDLQTIGAITASFGLAVIAGRLLGGWLLDRMWAPAIAMIVLLIPATGSWLLAQQELTMATAFLSVLAIGIGAGFEFDLLAFLISRYFGQRNYGTIYGCFYTIIALGGGLGPVVYGYVFDLYGTYRLALMAGSACLLLGPALFLLLGPYPKWNGED